MSKILTNPVVWILASLFLGIILSSMARKKKLRSMGRYSILTGTLLFMLLSSPLVADLLSYSLEKSYRFPEVQNLTRLDVIVVLGGGGVPAIGLRTEPELARRAYPRLYHGVRLFQAGCADQLAFCGGTLGGGNSITESQIMRDMALQMGVPGASIITEGTSQTTQQNVANLAKILSKKPIHRIGLVTSATHMRRSERVLQHYFPGVAVVPIPVNFQYNPPVLRLGYFIPHSRSLEESHEALHEHIGFLWYRIRYGV